MVLTEISGVRRECLRVKWEKYNCFRFYLEMNQGLVNVSLLILNFSVHKLHWTQICDSYTLCNKTKWTVTIWCSNRSVLQNYIIFDFKFKLRTAVDIKTQSVQTHSKSGGVVFHKTWRYSTTRTHIFSVELQLTKTLEREKIWEINNDTDTPGIVWFSRWGGGTLKSVRVLRVEIHSSVFRVALCQLMPWLKNNQPCGYVCLSVKEHFERFMNTSGLFLLDVDRNAFTNTWLSRNEMILYLDYDENLIYWCFANIVQNKVNCYIFLTFTILQEQVWE